MAENDTTAMAAKGMSKEREREIESYIHAVASGCNGRNFRSYSAMNDLFAEVRRLRESEQSLAGACKAWVSYFDRLCRNDEPGDPLAAARNQYHGERIEATRDALARATPMKGPTP